VGNSLYIDGKTPGLVLTGPNAGGKTIILKTLGTASKRHKFHHLTLGIL
jgi:dsDNA-specific endonuclease/ATPase MutS2